MLITVFSLIIEYLHKNTLFNRLNKIDEVNFSILLQIFNYLVYAFDFDHFEIIRHD